MENEYKKINANKLFYLYSFNNCIIVDIRTPLEYARGHIPGSLNIPLETLIKQPMLYLNPHFTYYIICKNGTRSAQLVTKLAQQSYPVVNVIGGIDSWEGPIEKDRCFS
ncbi:MAG: rhodanese-like domain-containing protein [Bacilli bacterium]|nr:rhodanese-like domain-containing protein [Bacilli bacterium]MDD4076530.1 rhodanese-like domain-containing protein [Bacilli bacterium]MDD4387866.1 rhodanese-like domain-containing protein [Bacilli bacterium]